MTLPAISNLSSFFDTQFSTTKILPYKVTIDDAHDDDCMTSAGCTVAELDPIDGCCLTPGHPSPIGRCPDTGELAYPVEVESEHIDMRRSDAAGLALLLARALPGVEHDKEHPAHMLFLKLRNTAAPAELLEGETAHEQMTYQCQLAAISTTGASPLRPRAPWVRAILENDS